MSEATRWLVMTAADPTVERIFPKLAKEIGLNESILLMQIAHWISISKNIREGVYWTYHSVRELHRDYFPYWSTATIWRTINSLKESGYILVSEFNDRKGDNTQWFALEPDKLSTLTSILVMAEKLPVQEPTPFQNETPPFQNETTLPEITTEKKKKISSRKRDAFYDAISECFGITSGGWIGNVKSMMLGTAKKGQWAQCNFDPPVTDAAEILAFKPYMQQRMAEKNCKEITACVTIQRWFYDFRAASQPKAAPAVAFDLSKWTSNNSLSFLEGENI